MRHCLWRVPPKRRRQTGQILQNRFAARHWRAPTSLACGRGNRADFGYPSLAFSCLDTPASEKMNSIAATMYAAVTSPEDMVILQLFVKATDCETGIKAA